MGYFTTGVTLLLIILVFEGLASLFVFLAFESLPWMTWYHIHSYTNGFRLRVRGVRLSIRIFIKSRTGIIYSCNDEALREALEVPLQKAFVRPYFVLSSDVADTRLCDLGIPGILSCMNGIFGTPHELTTAMERLLQFCMDNFTDFGQAYSLLRRQWHRDMDPLTALGNIEESRKKDGCDRWKALKDDVVVDATCPPRRLWDLCSNRVMPFWVLQVSKWLAVSHSWMEENRRHKISSPINAHEWPVPIPIDTSLERIRIELLNLAAEAAVVEEMWITRREPKVAAEVEVPEKYWTKWKVMEAEIAMNEQRQFTEAWESYSVVWLDVVCLRQEGVASNEDRRKEEWKLDVPTIGPIYKNAGRVVYYFSGLGRPFEAPSDKSDSRHWMNRAWTLQETQPRIIVAGRSPSSPKIPYHADLSVPYLTSTERDWKEYVDCPKADDVVRALMMPFIENNRPSAWKALSLMRGRTGTSELDKIAGLIYRFNCFQSPLPAYIVGEDTEAAWDRLIKATRSDYRAELFFTYAEPGSGKHIWYPSWRQIMEMAALPTDSLRDAVSVHKSSGEIPFLPTFENWDREIIYNVNTHTYSISCHSLEQCRVEGLSDVGSDNNLSSRRGKVHGTVADRWGIHKNFEFLTIANHTTPIKDGWYTLVGYVEANNDDRYQWVLARRTEDDFVEKVSVIQFEDTPNIKEMHHDIAGRGHSPRHETLSRLR